MEKTRLYTFIIIHTCIPLPQRDKTRQHFSTLHDSVQAPVSHLNEDCKGIMVALTTPHDILDFQHRIERRTCPEYLVNEEGNLLKDHEGNRE